ncbi:MAG TPA: formyltransferase family protein [Methanocorpusculum sp.]|nr:formyltransferase family protein [Methanocorpusculum sp.]
MGGRILLLTNNRNALKLYDSLKQMGENVELYSEKLYEEQLLEMKPSFIISYNYNHIIPEKIISIMPEKMVNLHISYLPWNKGSDPNFWSFIENTPKGVTIHKIDAHLDTGSILYQEEVTFDENIETFRTSYNKLNDKIVELFCRNWKSIKEGSSETINKEKNITGTYHKRIEFINYTKKYPLNYDDRITDYKNKYNIP